MKKIIIFIVSGIIILVLALSVFLNFNKSESNDKKLEKVTLAEVAHTIFYAPQYVAIEKGYFECVCRHLEIRITGISRIGVNRKHLSVNIIRSGDHCSGIGYALRIALNKSGIGRTHHKT